MEDGRVHPTVGVIICVVKQEAEWVYAELLRSVWHCKYCDQWWDFSRIEKSLLQVVECLPFTAPLQTAVIKALRKGDELIWDSSRFAWKMQHRWGEQNTHTQSVNFTWLNESHLSSDATGEQHCGMILPKLWRKDIPWYHLVFLGWCPLHKHLKGTYDAYSRSIFIFWGSTGISLHDLQFKKLLIYLILALYAAPFTSFPLS